MTSTSAKRRILVVDDNSDITITIKTGLDDGGLFQVDTFTTLNLHCHLFDLDYMTWFFLTLKCQRCMVMNYMMK
jgi:hypothetical protein